MIIKGFPCAQPKLFLTDKKSALLLRCIGEKNHECMQPICLLMAHFFSKDKSRSFCKQLTTFSQTNWVQEISREHFFPELSQSRSLLKNIDLTSSDTSSGHPRRPFSRRPVDFTPYIYVTHSRQPLTHNVEVFTFPLAVELLSLYLISFISFASLSICNRSESSPLSNPLSSPALTDTLFLWHIQ